MSATTEALRVLQTRLPFKVVEADKGEVDVKEAVLVEMRVRKPHGLQL